jgi:hypothetical protein
VVTGVGEAVIVMVQVPVTEWLAFDIAVTV